MESKPYDIVLLPSDNLLENALKVSETLEKLDTYFTLDNKMVFPHISIYMTQLNEEGLEKVKSVLSGIAERTKAVELKADKYNYENTYIDIEYTKNKEIIDLQSHVIEGVNPIRDGMRKKDEARLVNAVGEARSNLVKYGWINVGDLYAPHLTFTRFKSDHPEAVETLPSRENFNGAYASIGIFEMGDNGTCIKKIGAWELQGS